MGTDDETADTLVLSLVSGPVEFTPDTFYSNFTVGVCFYPETEGEYSFVWQVQDRRGTIDVDTVIYTVMFNHLPIIENQEFAAELCYGATLRELPVAAVDPDQNPLRFELLSGPGTIDENTGVISYQAVVTGVTNFEVAVYDACGGDTAVITDYVLLNQPPQLLTKDTVIFLCEPQEICIDVAASDPEGGAVSIIEVDEVGQFTQMTDTTGRTCFMPDAVDSAVYTFYYCLSDECPIEEKATPPCIADSILVTVVINRPPYFTVCPEMQEFNTCAVDTFCFDVNANDPEFGPLIYNIISGNATIDGRTVCVIGSESDQFDVVIEAVDECAATDTCIVPVLINGNRPPVITPLADQTISLCAPETFCFSAYVADDDYNLDTMILNYGYYDKVTSRICVDVDTSGIYEIILIARDECGAEDTDTALIMAVLNEIPTAEFLNGDTAVTLCELTELCFKADIYDDNIKNLYISQNGYYNDETGDVCFTPDSSGEYQLTVYLEDYCNIVAADTINVSVILRDQPPVVTMNDTTVFLCAPDYVCLPVEISDADGDIVSINPSRGTYNNGQLCFVPYDKGDFTLTLTVTDECGHVTVDTAVVTIVSDDVQLSYPDDTTVFLCEPRNLCFYIGGIPDGAEVRVFGTNVTYDPETDSVCFYSDCCLDNNIRVEVTTVCSTYVAEFTVYVQTNSAPMVRLPADTTVFGCLAGEICLPVSISDIDGNVDSVEAIGGVYNDYYETLCLYPDTPGIYVLSIIATDECGVRDRDSIKVTVEINRPPQIDYTLENPVIRQCTFEQICVPVNAFDPDGNLTSILVDTPYYYNANSGAVCFLPDREGEYSFTVFAIDECGLKDSAVVTMTVELGHTVSVTCPEVLTPFYLCQTDTLCLEVAIEGIYDNVTVSPAAAAWFADGQVCFVADTTGSYEITIRIEGECNVDSCVATIPVVMLESVALVCPEDTVYNFDCAVPYSITVPFEVIGDYDSLIFTPEFATYIPGEGLNVPIDGATLNRVTAKAYGQCNVDSCEFYIMIDVNEPPVVEVKDTTVVLCDLEQICIPVKAVDNDNMITGVVVEGYGEIVDELFCFTPAAFDIYTFKAIVTDECGTSDTATFTVNVLQGDNVTITCPGQLPDTTICGSQEICLEMNITGANYQLAVLPEGKAYYEEGYLCFNADTSGLYQFTVIGFAGCNNDTCVVTIPVSIVDSVHIACPDQEVNIAECVKPRSVNVPLTITGDYIDLVFVPDDISYSEGMVNIPTNEPGLYPVMVIASGLCNTDTCEFTVNLEINQPPVLTVQPDTTLTVCTLEGLEVLVKFHLSDPDNNIDFYGANPGQINDSIVYFYPETYGEHHIVIFAQDTCGVRVEDTVAVSISEGQTAVIENCQELPMYVGMETFPDTIRYSMPITPADAIVSVDGGFWNNDTLSVVIAEPGTYNVMVTAEALCGADTCNLTFVINEYIPPQVICHDTAAVLCLLEPQTICVPVEYSGTDLTVVSNPGYFENGSACFEVTEPGEYVIEVIASNMFENELRADTCYITAVIDGGQDPAVAFGQDDIWTLCEPANLCIPVTVTPGDFNIINYVANYGVYDAQKGELCALFDTAGVYIINLTAYDDCGNSAGDEIVITVNLNTPPTVDLGDDFSQMICEPTEICIPFTTADSDGNLTGVYAVTAGYIKNNDQICFTADTAGVYQVIVEAIDACEAVGADTVYVTVEGNQAPVIEPLADTTVFLCAPTYICLPASFSDPNDNISTVTVNRGKYSNGEICFVPYDSGNYYIELKVTDECGLQAVDTAVVRVLTEQSVKITCPNDTTVFLCEPQNLCFHIDGIPDGASVKVFGTNVTYDPVTDSVCFYSDCCLDNTIRVEVTTTCATYTCEFTVYVQTNTAPMVRLPADTTILQCELAQICLPVAINDIDGNVDSVAVTGASYNAYYQTACFTPETSGEYVIRVTAYDECGASDFDEIKVTVIENRPPFVDLSVIPDTFKLCELTEVCFEATVGDEDGNLGNIVISPNGRYDADKGTICFTPGSFGDHWVNVRAIDTCDIETEDSILISVIEGDYVSIDCPEPIDTVLCQAGTVCIPIAIEGNLISLGETDSIRTYPAGITSYEDGRFCFLADSSGLYTLTLAAETQCNTDSCTFTVAVEILEPLAIICPNDVNLFVCDTLTVIEDIVISSSVTEVIVTDTAMVPAYIIGSQVYVPIRQEGSREITLTAKGYCGEVSCSFNVTADFNTPPVVVAGPDTVLTECELFEVCVPFTVTDIDGNIERIETSHGVFTNNKVCFNPADYSGFGVYDISVTAYDSCQTSHSDMLRVTYNLGDSARIEWCPDELFFSSCEPDSVYFPLNITPANAAITILPNGRYDSVNHRVGVYVDTAGTYHVTISVDARCYDTSCSFPLYVERFEPPQITAPDEIDTLLCFAEQQTFCFDVVVAGTGVDVTVLLDGQSDPSVYYAAGKVCGVFDGGGSWVLTIIGVNVCGSDTAYTTLNITENVPPVIHLPETMTFERCPDDTDRVCIDGIFATDVESGVVIRQVCGPDDAFENITADSGRICFYPDEIKTYEFCFEAEDDCYTVNDTFYVNFILKEDCDVCLTVWMESGDCTPVGLKKDVDIMVETNDAIAGFDLYLRYDASAISFVAASKNGSVIEEWEYFTYNLNEHNTGEIRLVGIADINDGPNHPPSSSLNPDGILATIQFQVANDQNLGNNYVPISFYWYDCGDNTFSDVSGAILYMDNRIYNSEGILIWDEETDPDASRPMGVGAPDSCLQNDSKELPLRCIDFYNGAICIIHPDSIDDRGDVNLNSIPCEIADGVLFTNYFIYGLSVFDINLDGQIAATDVNADGMTLTVADLVYLIRVIIGDENPYPKINPYNQDLIVVTGNHDGLVDITLDAVSTVGAAYFVYEIGDEVELGEPRLVDNASGMDIMYRIDDGQLRMLVYNIGTAMIPSGINRIVEIPVGGDGEINMVKTEVVDYHGQPYNAVNQGSLIPEGFKLQQNYPNPFNPSTRIEFSLPTAASWTLTIYNVTGKVVREYTGSNEAGSYEVLWDGTNGGNNKAASGVYFYRLETNDFCETKKMILLK
ncbi:MAG: T9SS type A sorting domain-containing protein [Candidatus Zixiibacteriota bacterium]